MWTGLGESEVVLRGLSVLFGIATIPVVYALGVRLFGAIPAVAAAVLLSVNAFFVQRMQDARGYTLAILLITVASLLFVDVLWSPRRSRTIGYVVTATLAVYAHLFSALVVATHLVSIAFAGRREVATRNLTAAVAAIIVAIAPVVALAVTSDVGQIDWIREPTLGQLAAVTTDLTGAAGTVVAIGYVAALALAAGAFLSSRRDRGNFDAWRYAFVVLWAVVPIVLTFAVSFVKPMFQARYLAIAMPGLALGAAAGAATLRGRLAVVSVVAASAALFFSARALDRWYDSPGTAWAERVDDIVSSSESNDAIVFYAPTIVRPYLYYATRAEVVDDLPVLAYPESYSWLGFSRTRYEPDYDGIARAASEHGRMWVVAGAAWDEPRRRELRTIRHLLGERCAEVMARYEMPSATLYGGCRSSPSR